MAKKHRNKPRKTGASRAQKKKTSPAHDTPEDLVERGLKHHQANELEMAETMYRKALEKDPECSDAYNLIGAIALTVGIVDDANAYFCKAIAINAEVPSYHLNHALALRAQNRLDEACEAARKAIMLQPNYAEAWNTIGQSLMDQERWGLAVEALEKAVASRSDYGEGWVNLCGALQEIERQEEAVEAGLHGIRHLPDLPQSYYNLARALDGVEKWEEATNYYLECIDRDPAFAKGYVNFSRCLIKMKDTKGAEAYAIKAIELAPDDFEAHTNYGSAKLGQGEFADAIRAFRKAISLNSEAIIAHNNLGHALLALGDFQGGWKEYEYGIVFGERGPLIATPAAEWRGEPLEGRTIHVSGEQGVGEHIMFATMLPDLISRGANVIYECDERLAAMFERSNDDYEVVIQSYPPAQRLMASDIDFRVLAGSLGQWLRTSQTDFVPSEKFLTADPELTRQYRDRYRALGDQTGEGKSDDRIIGISWKSNSPNHALDKNIPIQLWRPILQTPGCKFVSLQYGEVAEDLAWARDSLGVDVHVDHDVSALNSLEQNAAQVSAVDLVVSISNATVHIAGACGIPTWALLGHPPLWHWFLEREDTLWYESVKLYRQKIQGEWDPLLQGIAEKLRTSTGEG